MNSISGGANFVPQHNNFISNAAQTGTLAQAAKGQVRTQDDEEVAHQNGEQAQLSRLAQQAIDQSKEQQQGKANENARQSGADAGIMDDLAHDGGEQNEVNERNRQHQLGKSKDGHAVHGGQAPGQPGQNGASTVGHEEQLEIGEIGRRPDEVLSDVPAHAKAFAQGNVEAQLANPGQVDKLTEIKPIPHEQQVEADSPELKPVSTLGPILGDKETGEVSHPSPQTEGRAPTSVAREFDPEQMAQMERVVAEQQLAREQAGEGEMLIAGGLPGGGGSSVTGPSPREEATANFTRARNELLESTGGLEQYGWGGYVAQLLHKHGGNEQAAAYELKGTMAQSLNQTNPDLQQIWKESVNHPDGFKNYVSRTRDYIAEHGHKYSAEDVDAATKMLNCADKCDNFVNASQAMKEAGATPPSKEKEDALSTRLLGSMQGMSPSFQSEFKAEMNRLDQAGKLNEHNMNQAAGAVSSNMAARTLQGMNPRDLTTAPGQTEEETRAIEARALAKKAKWDQDGVDGDLSDAMLFEQSNWAAQQMKANPNEDLKAYQSRVDFYVDLNTMMRQGYSLSSGNHDYYDKSAYAQREAGKA